MTAIPTVGPAGPSLADQVSRLYDLIAGYHLTNLIEVAREVGRLGARSPPSPGIASAKLAAELGTDPATRTSCAGPRSRSSSSSARATAGGWRPTWTRSSATRRRPSTSAGRRRSTWSLGGEDYPDTGGSSPERSGRALPGPQRRPHRRGRRQPAVAAPDLRRPGPCRAFRSLGARLAAGARVLDLGCGAGWAIVELAERFPASRVDGADIEPRSVELAQERIVRHGLTDRCSARLLGPDGLTDEARYDVITMFLVVHEIRPEMKDDVLASAARALAPGGSLVIFDEAYPETDPALRTMPSRFSAVAQWFELTWGNRIDTAAELRARCARAGLRLADETTFSRFTILVAEKLQATGGDTANVPS